VKTNVKKIVRACVLGPLVGIPLGILVSYVLIPEGFNRFYYAWIKEPPIHQTLKASRLAYPSLQDHGFDPNALVLLSARHVTSSTVNVRYQSVGAVIGDGSLIVTAAHCVTDLLKQPPQKGFYFQRFAISPYWGELYDVEVVAIDEQADIALLRASWPYHPALAVGDMDDFINLKEMWAATRSLATKEVFSLETPDAALAGLARMEKLTVVDINGPTPDMAIQLENTRYVVPGWSGSPMITPESGRLLGVLTTCYTNEVRAGRFLARDAKGARVDSVRALCRAHNLEGHLTHTICASAVPRNASQRYATLLEAFNPTDGRVRIEVADFAERLLAWDDDSVNNRLLCCDLLLHPSAKRTQVRDRLLMRMLIKLQTMDPDHVQSNLRRAYYFYQKKMAKRAQGLVDKVLVTEPNHPWALYTDLKLAFGKDKEKAVARARQLTEIDPNTADYWFGLCQAYEQCQQYEKALDAIQMAVQVKPDGKYERHVGRSLAALDRLDEAENSFRQATEKCACPTCWLDYADFLVKHRANDVNDLHQAEQAFVEMGDRPLRQAVHQQRYERIRYKLALAHIELVDMNTPIKQEGILRDLLDDHSEVAYYWWELADVLRTQERYEEAENAALKAVDLAPERSYRARLADTHARAGHLEQAAEVYFEMLAKYPKRARYWYWYGRYLVDYCQDQVDELPEILDKASDPQAGRPVDVNDLQELREDYLRIKDRV
jgi:tetratricopeptide (TPR) repeat protein